MSQSNQIKLHLGCGSRNFGDEWVHIDQGDYPHVTSHSVINLPYPDNSVDIIYASHLLAYFSREEAITVLRKWFKVLKKGGKLRLATTDFTAITHLYRDHDVALSEILGPLFGRIKVDGNYYYHKTVYDCLELFNLLEKIGFKDMYEYEWQNTPPHDKIDDQSRAYYPSRPANYKKNKFDKDQTLISLNIEAIK